MRTSQTLERDLKTKTQRGESKVGTSVRFKLTSHSPVFRVLTGNQFVTIITSVLEELGLVTQT